MQLEHLMTMRVRLGEPIPIGKLAAGTRSIGVVRDGTFEGPRLRGRIVPPGADWILFGADGAGAVDVRLALTTDDGANVYMHYTGVLEMNDAIGKALAGSGETHFGDAYFVTQPRFESGAAEYAWLNRAVAIAEGRVIPGGVEYRVFHCRPGGDR